MKKCMIMIHHSIHRKTIGARTLVHSVMYTHRFEGECACAVKPLQHPAAYVADSIPNTAFKMPIKPSILSVRQYKEKVA